MAKQNAADIEAQIEALQAQLAEARAAERADALETVKELQKRHRFTKRELGSPFNPLRRRSVE